MEQYLIPIQNPYTKSSVGSPRATYTTNSKTARYRKYSLVPSIVDELFQQEITSYSPRNSDFDIPSFLITINNGKHSLRYQGPHMWSKLQL